MVPNNYNDKQSSKIYFYEAILLANKEPVEYEKSVPVQIKYLKDSKKNKDNIVGKLLIS